MQRYGIITEKNPREIVLLRGNRLPLAALPVL